MFEGVRDSHGLADAFRSVALGVDAYFRRIGHEELIDFLLTDPGVKPLRIDSMSEAVVTVAWLRSAADRVGDMPQLLRANINAMSSFCNLAQTSRSERLEHTLAVHGCMPRQVSLRALGMSYFTARGLFRKAYPHVPYTPKGVAEALRCDRKVDERGLRTLQQQIAELVLHPFGVSEADYDVVYGDPSVKRAEWVDMGEPGIHRPRMRLNVYDGFSRTRKGVREQVLVHGNAHLLNTIMWQRAVRGEMRGVRVPHDAAAEIVLLHGPLSPVMEGFANVIFHLLPELQSLGAEYSAESERKIHAQLVWHTARLARVQEWTGASGFTSEDHRRAMYFFNLWNPNRDDDADRSQRFTTRWTSPLDSIELAKYELGAVMLRPLSLLDEQSAPKLLARVLSGPCMISEFEAMIDQSKVLSEYYWGAEPQGHRWFTPPYPWQYPFSPEEFPPLEDGTYLDMHEWLTLHNVGEGFDEVFGDVVDRMGDDALVALRCYGMGDWSPELQALADDFSILCAAKAAGDFETFRRTIGRE